MDKESYFGNIEYKRFIKYSHTNINSKKNRKESLISQLKFRLKEGNGTCIYNIGVDDNGEISDINISDFDESLENIQDMCDSIDANISSIKKINSINQSNYDKYYYKITINDNITNEEYRILNVSNLNNNIELIGFDNNNNLLKLDENILYDIKKNSKILVYIKNHHISSGEMNLIKNILSFKPQTIYFNEDYEASFKLLTLLKKLKIDYKFSSQFEVPILSETNTERKCKSFLSIFQTLFNGTLLNNNKIYACITNKNIDNFDNFYFYNMNEITKFNINEIQHINQPVSKINSNKLISLSTNLKINGDYHICNSNKCNVKYTNIIYYNLSDHLDIEIELNDIEYNAYYKNNLLNVKIYKDHIKLNKNVYLDEEYLIIDLINFYHIHSIKL
jgi:hypothetical protein